MPLIFTLALQNLFHDRLRFIATVIGIMFSIALVTVQMGLYLGFGRTVTTMIDHASADLWIMPRGTKCFEDLSLLDVKSHRPLFGLPPEKWSSLMYGLWPDGGLKNGKEATHG